MFRKKLQKSVFRKAATVVFAGILMSVSLTPAFASENRGTVSWKEVSQDINSSDEYVYDGSKKDPSMTSLAVKKSSTGILGYINKGVVQKSSGSLLVSNIDGWWYMRNGWKQDTSGLVKIDDKNWYSLVSGRLQVSANETIGYTGSTWVYMKDGISNTGYTGLVQNENGIYWVTNGVINWNYTNIVKDTIGVADGGWLYMKNGAFYSSADTVAKNDNGWWKIRDGLVDFNYNGLAKNDNGWWYISGGAVNFNYNGAVQNEKGIWYVSGGKVDFYFNGAAYGYYFVGGCAQ